ncbi:hypothetical protein [Selenomonas ruminantium]|uniref:hypothetical protein n=1 Tax=Selenomonas ruminantium TaxID=971 RepID=UPI0026EAE4FD|nr:hypothetical protein [Selenomonas ruminantium]
MKEVISAVGVASKVVESAVSSVFSIVDGIFKSNMELTEIANIYSKRLDELILSEEKKELKYVGGTFNIIYLNDVAFETNFELYFQDKAKSWVKKEAKSKPQKMSFLKDTAKIELQKLKKVSFEIDHPKEEKEDANEQL